MIPRESILQLMIVAAVLIICFAFLIEAVFGFGGGLIAIPLLSLFLGVQDAVTTVLLFQFGMGTLLLKSHVHIDWRHAWLLTVGLLLGTTLGTYGLATIDEGVLTKILAGSILFFLALPMLRSSPLFSRKPSSVFGIFFGVAGGWFQGIIGSGGPVFTMYLSTIIRDTRAIRATLIFVFFMTSIVRVAASVSLGLFHYSIIHLAAITLVPYLCALWIGNRIHTQVTPEHFRTGVNIILLFAAILLLLK